MWRHFSTARNLYAIEGILKLKDQPFWFGGCRKYAVAFPDSRNVGQLPNDVDPSIVFSPNTSTTTIELCVALFVHGIDLSRLP